MDDSTLNASYIHQVYNDSLLFSHLPPHAWRNLCIAAIRSENPIMADSYSYELRRHEEGDEKIAASHCILGECRMHLM